MIRELEKSDLSSCGGVSRSFVYGGVSRFFVVSTLKGGVLATFFVTRLGPHSINFLDVLMDRYVYSNKGFFHLNLGICDGIQIREFLLAFQTISLSIRILWPNCGRKSRWLFRWRYCVFWWLYPSNNWRISRLFCQQVGWPIAGQRCWLLTQCYERSGCRIAFSILPINQLNRGGGRLLYQAIVLPCMVPFKSWIMKELQIW